MARRKKLSKRQKEVAEEAIEVIPHAIRGFQRAYPGISRKLAYIDTVSVAHLAVVVASRTYDPKQSQLTTYFTRAIHNSLLKELHREKRLRYGSSDRVPMELAEKDRESEHWKHELAASLSTLTNEQRQLVRARYFDQKTFEEMAEEFGCDRRTVRRRLTEVINLLGEFSENPEGDASEQR